MQASLGSTDTGPAVSKQQDDLFAAFEDSSSDPPPPPPPSQQKVNHLMYRGGLPQTDSTCQSC